MSIFKNRQHKLLFLFDYNSDTYKSFKTSTNALQDAADTDREYRTKESAFCILVAERLKKEWKKVDFPL